MSRCRVTIDRGRDNVQHFEGVIIGETTTHYLVTHRNNSLGEWFAKSAPPFVHVIPFLSRNGK